MYLGPYIFHGDDGREEQCKSLADIGTFVGDGTISQQEINDIDHDVSDELGRGSFGVAYRANVAGEDLVVKVPIKALVTDSDYKEVQHEAHIAQLLLEGPTYTMLFPGGVRCQRMTKEDATRVQIEVRTMQLIPGYYNIHPIKHFSGGNITSVRCVNNLHYLRYRSSHFQLNPGGPLPQLWLHMGVQIMNGIDYMHSQGIAHLDMKLANILYTDNFHCYISDFGLSTNKPSGIYQCGTDCMMAPEVFPKNRPYGSAYDTKLADLYSLALTLIDLLDMSRVHQDL